MNVHTPISGETFLDGTTCTITWSSYGVDNVVIEYSTDSGASWQEIAKDINESAKRYEWTVPDNPSNNVTIRITDTSDLGISGISPEAFEIFTPVLTLEHEPLTSAPENAAVEFKATINSNTAVEEVIVYYDKSGEREFNQSLVMNVTGDTYLATLSSELFTGYGIEYYITVKDSAGREERYPKSGYASIQAQVSDVKSEVTVEGGSEQTAYRCRLFLQIPPLPIS